MNSTPGQSDVTTFFSVARRKFVIMSVATFGLYQLFWMYKNWKAIKRFTNQDISPLFRSIFSVIFCYFFFKQVKEKAVHTNIPVEYSPGSIAVLWIIFGLLSYLPEPFSFAALLNFIPLLCIRKTIDDTNANIDSNFERNEKLSAWNIGWIVFAIVVVVLAFICTVFLKTAEQGAAANP